MNRRISFNIKDCCEYWLKAFLFRVSNFKIRKFAIVISWNVKPGGKTGAIKNISSFHIYVHANTNEGMEWLWSYQISRRKCFFYESIQFFPDIIKHNLQRN